MPSFQISKKCPDIVGHKFKPVRFNHVLFGENNETALQAEHLHRVVVSTEDDAIARVASDWGAEVPFRRPPELATDDVSIIPVAQHALAEMESLGFSADVVVSLQPTSPFVVAEDIEIELDYDAIADEQGHVMAAW